MAATDAASALPSGRPRALDATRVIVAWLLFWNGAASCVAWMDAELAGRKPLVVSLATEASDGNAFTEKTVTTIQPDQDGRQRKRTEKWPRPVNSRVMAGLRRQWWSLGGGVGEGRRSTSSLDEPLGLIQAQAPATAGGARVARRAGSPAGRA